METIIFLIAGAIFTGLGYYVGVKRAKPLEPPPKRTKLFDDKPSTEEIKGQFMSKPFANMLINQALEEQKKERKDRCNPSP